MFFSNRDSLSVEEKQRQEKNIQAGNPFEKFGYTPKISTLSKGKYLEFHDQDSIVQIGSFTFNVKNKMITGYILKETKYSEATLRPEIVSRWFSPDPLADEFPDWSPYVFTNNNPIFFTDPTGLAPETIFENSITKEKVEVDDGINRTIVVNEENFEKAKEFASLGKLNAQNFSQEQFNEYSSFYDSQLYGVSFEDRLSNLGKYLADGFTEQIFDSGLKNPHADIAVLEDYGLLSGGAGASKGIKWANKMLKKYPGSTTLQQQIGDYWNFSVKVPGTKNGYPDPLASEFPSWSPYVFTNDNPIFFTDPTGLAVETIYRNMSTDEEVEVLDGIDKTIEVSDSDFQKAKAYADRINPIDNGDGSTTIQIVDSYTASSYNDFYDSVNSYSGFSLANVKDYLFNRPQLFTTEALGGAGGLEAISGQIVKASSIAFKSFTRGNYRHNLKVLTNSLGMGQDAHHIYPQAKRFQKQFERAEINIHNPVNLRWWEKSAHRSASKAYNRAWDGFFTRHPNASGDEIKAFGRSIAKDYGI